jgi:CDP-diacylglycerol--glycerol-3-phosphate 3-phosphatidyltransferase
VFPLNTPNVLTVLRIMLVPVLIAALLDRTHDGDVLAAIVFAVASLTDFIDGWIARSRSSITTFGKLMDPVADKLLVIAALLALVSLHRLDAWVAMVIIAREFAVTATRVAAVQSGVVIPANRSGKVKTGFQVATIFLLIAISPRPTWLSVLVYVTVVITVLSGIDYFFGLRRELVQAARTRALERAGRAETDSV